jgi:hypothetical protein
MSCEENARENHDRTGRNPPRAASMTHFFHILLIEPYDFSLITEPDAKNNHLICWLPHQGQTLTMILDIRSGLSNLVFGWNLREVSTHWIFRKLSHPSSYICTPHHRPSQRFKIGIVVADWARDGYSYRKLRVQHLLSARQIHESRSSGFLRPVSRIWKVGEGPARRREGDAELEEDEVGTTLGSKTNWSVPQ